MIEIGGSWIIGNYVLAFAMVVLVLFVLPMTASSLAARRVAAGPGRLGRWHTQAAGWGSKRQDVYFDWRYRDAAGHDVTDQVMHADMVTHIAEAVQNGSGRVLLRVQRRDHGWQIMTDGGHFGDQVDAVVFTTIHATPWDAMTAVLRPLGLTAIDGFTTPA
jgi:hypothetical protein